MRQLRMWCALFFAWMFLLYNIERLHEPINLASFIYVLSASIAVLIVITPRLQRLSLAGLLLSTLPLILGLKFWLGYRLFGTYLPITVTEVGATWLTIALAMKMARSFEDLRTAALSTLLTHLHDRTQPFEKGQAEIYREIRRARIHHRPLALFAVSAEETSVTAALDRFTVELQRDCARNYVSARLAELLSCEMAECDTITHLGNHFVTVLPEADEERASQAIDKLRRLARERLGIELQVGVSLFPDDEVTFVRLLEQAQDRMRKPPAREPSQETGSVRWSDDAVPDRVFVGKVQEEFEQQLTSPNCQVDIVQSA